MFKNGFRIFILLCTAGICSGFPLSAQTPNKLTDREKQEGWELLFDGETFTGLNKLAGSGWDIEDGAIKAQITEESGGHSQKDFITAEKYGNFELVFDFMISNKTNSGVKYLVTDDYPGQEGQYLGLEYQILDNVNFEYPERGELRTLASLYDLIPADTQETVPFGEWSTAKIVVIGNHIEHWLNGKKVVGYNRGSTRFKSLVRESKYKNFKDFGQTKQGHILFQNEGSAIAFRSIKIKPMEGILFPETPGLVSYTYRNSFEKNVPATLDTIKNLGIVDMEFSNLFNTPAASLRKMLDERGIKCSSFGVSYDDFVNSTEEVANNAKILGATFVRVAWIPHEDTFDLEDAKKTVSDFNRAGKLLKEKHNLTFCYHNHGYEFGSYKKGTLFDYLMENTDPKYVSFEMDILWTFFPGQDPAQLLVKYGKRFKLMHLKDLRKGVKGDASGKTSQENDVVLGTGQLDIPAILKAAKKAGIEHYYIEDESKLKSVQVPQTMVYLKSLKE